MEKKNKLIQVVLSLFIFIGFFIIANHLKRTETIPYYLPIPVYLYCFL